MRILLTGNTGYVTQAWIEHAFPGCRVLITGTPQVKSHAMHGISVLEGRNAEYRKLFEAYDIDTVVVFSHRLTYRSRQHGELEQLEELLDVCRAHAPQRVLYLDGPNTGDEAQESAVSRAAVQLCMRACSENVQVRVVQLPYLYSGANKEDFLYGLFADLEREGDYDFGTAPGQRVNMMSCMDLAELIRRFMEEWPQSSDVLRVPDTFGTTFVDLERALQTMNPAWRFEYDLSAAASEPAVDDQVLRRSYGFVPQRSLIDELLAEEQKYQSAKPKKRTAMEKFALWRGEHKKLFLFIELLVAVALTVLCGRLANWQYQFRLIDFRLLLVVLLSTMYGFNMGMLAATAASVLLLMAYAQQGFTWLTLFYEPANWISFIAYYTVGAVCGYLRLIANDKVRFVEEENEKMRGKLRFVQALYLDVLSDKREYKKQIVGSKDSFGKIFEITQKLNVMDEQEVFIKAIEIIENIMDNHSVALYSVDNGQYLRLIASSKALGASLPVSNRLSAYQEALDTIEKGEVYVNNGLLKGYPMYMVGMHHNGELVSIAFVQEADYAQMSLYYINLFKILCGLISSSLAHALEHQDNTRDQRCVGTTHVLKPAYFEKRLEQERRKDEQKIATHILLHLDGMGKSVEEMDAVLSTRVRKCDIVGYAPDGELYLILAQATYQSLPVIEKRLSDAGIRSELVRVEEVY